MYEFEIDHFDTFICLPNSSYRISFAMEPKAKACIFPKIMISLLQLPTDCLRSQDLRGVGLSPYRVSALLTTEAAIILSSRSKQS